MPVAMDTALLQPDMLGGDAGLRQVPRGAVVVGRVVGRLAGDDVTGIPRRFGSCRGVPACIEQGTRFGASAASCRAMASSAGSVIGGS